MTDTDPIQTGLIQLLESERLLGVREIPVRVKVGSPATAPAKVRKSGSQTEPPTAAPPTRRLTTPAELDEKATRLRVLDESQVKGCVRCGLSATRTQTVFGQGSPNARLVFVGEAPGYEEDRTGLAFVGRAGQLLTKMIEAMGLTRDDVYICNVIKCRPPENRTPAADEINACSSYLFEQLSTIQPEVIVALGAPAAKTLLNTADSIGHLRGRFHDFRLGGPMATGAPIPLMPTYHPAYLLRTPGDKAKAWEDLKQVMAKLGLPLPERPARAADAV